MRVCLHWVRVCLYWVRVSLCVPQLRQGWELGCLQCQYLHRVGIIGTMYEFHKSRKYRAYLWVKI